MRDRRIGFSLRLAVKALGGLILAILLALIVYAGDGYFDALRNSAGLKQRADALIAAGRGPDDLTRRKLDQLIRVDDPDFWQHSGVDLGTKGSGMTTITRALSKFLAFSKFKPGIRKIRQTAYAIGLERRLSKKQILALFLDMAYVGRGPAGGMNGMFSASDQVFGKPPSALTDRQWLRMVAVLLAPAQFDLLAPDKALDERVGKIERLLQGKCEPLGKRDVWLEGCAGP